MAEHPQYTQAIGMHAGIRSGKKVNNKQAQRSAARLAGPTSACCFTRRIRIKNGYCSYEATRSVCADYATS